MHLRAIKLRGFKSFPDPVEIRLEPGVAVVVGPNGSGKSNVADAILWAAGSLAPSELRAEKPDDVLFAGTTAGRARADFCEVELVFDNEDGAVAELPYSEVSIARRLHRGAEGQYLVNGTAVRRTDVVEVLADVGLGGQMGSIISQGRVEEILGSKPEERRTLVEEAAGLGKFKRRRHRAELKLARVAAEVERARDVEAEVRKRLRPLALQATAAERAEKLRGEIASVQARIAQLGLEEVESRRVDAEERRTTAAHARRRTDGELEALLRERDRVEGELVGAAGSREDATAALYRLRSATERLELRRESAQALADRLRAQPLPMRSPERERLREEARLARERLAALERTLAELEGLPPAARALAERGEQLLLSSLEVDSGDERAVAAALAWRAAAVRAPDAATGLKLLEQARAAGLGNLGVVVGDAELAPIVEKERLLEATELSVTREGFAYDPKRGELWYAGEAAEAVLLELEARRRALEAEIAELEERAERAVATAPEPPAELATAADRLARTLEEAAKHAARLEPSLRARVDARGNRARELGEELRELGGREAELRRSADEASERATAVDVELATIAAEAKEFERRIADAGAEPAEGDDAEELTGKLQRLERRREALGSVNPLAKEEYEREKERVAELAEQRADLEQSLAELEQLRNELTETVESRFAETFTSVRDHFADVAATLFPGGEGRLRLTEPELDGEDEDVETGIEIELRPAGKKVTRLSLLSGGEKALGAISFLFALFLARPHPFYLLDEVEAALDDTNIGRFVELLRRYSKSAQFIVVTHQKRTMEAADVLYGVTMGSEGVSQVVSRRLPREEPLAASA